MKNYLAFLFFLCIKTLSIYGQINFAAIEKDIYSGDIKRAENLLNTSLKFKKLTKKEKIQLYQFKGDIAKVEGDIETALLFWDKSAALSDKLYPNKKDFHKAWKYINRSNYHYNKINKSFAKKYADSCLSLIQNLNVRQQKELKIYKIWNLLAQSYKIQVDFSNRGKFNENNLFCSSFYEKSINFQIQHETPKHELAKTYHLIGNFNTDLAELHNRIKDKASILKHKKNALLNYNKAIQIWKELYGNIHHELGKTLFVQGLLTYYLSNGDIVEFKKSIHYFENSIQAYGLDKNQLRSQNLSKIPNKSDLLMCLKYYTTNLLFIYQKNSKEKEWLIKAQQINQIALKVWKEIHLTFSKDNTNQNLAIYSLVPHEETIAIIKLKGNLNVIKTKEVIFQANQKLKYFDLFKGPNDKINSSISIRTIQNRLSDNQIFFDFHFNETNREVYLIEITREKSILRVFDFDFAVKAYELNKTIVDKNYWRFCKLSSQISKKIFPQGIDVNTEIIVCPENIFYGVPFEALLLSKQNVNSKDYRKLDYLNKSATVRYVLSAADFSNKTETCTNELSVFTPSYYGSDFTELPFSKKLGKVLKDKFEAKNYASKNATVQAFFGATSSIRHISSHAEIEGDATANYIRFSDDSLFQEDLKLMKRMPKMLTINSCNSGNGRNLIGDGVYGMVRELHRIGVPSTISNLWEVDDKASNSIFEKFYGAMYSGESNIQALRTAKLEQIKNAPSSGLGAPYYWAGHRLVGGELKMTTTINSVNNTKYIIVTILLLLLLIKISRGRYWKK